MFKYERFISFCLWFIDTRRQIQFLKSFVSDYANNPHGLAHLVVF